MVNFHYITKENLKEDHRSSSQVSDLPYRILMIRASRSGKTNALFDLMGHQPDIDNIYLYAKDPSEAKY